MDKNFIYKTDPNKSFQTEERCHIIEIFKEDNAPLSIAQARVESGVTTALHSLSNTDEWYYILQGKGEMRVGNEKEIVEKGDVVKIPANEAQQITNIDSEDLIFLCICNPSFDVDAYKDLEK